MCQVVFIYVDDGFGSQPHRIFACAASSIQRKELKSSGFLCNEEKPNLTPTQIGQWLGFNHKCDFYSEFQIAGNKLSKVKGLLDICIYDSYCTYRYLAKIAGYIISCAPADGPIAPLFTREMYLTIETRSS